MNIINIFDGKHWAVMPNGAKIRELTDREIFEEIDYKISRYDRLVINSEKIHGDSVANLECGHRRVNDCNIGDMLFCAQCFEEDPNSNKTLACQNCGKVYHVNYMYSVDACSEECQDRIGY